MNTKIKQFQVKIPNVKLFRQIVRLYRCCRNVSKICDIKKEKNGYAIEQMFLQSNACLLY